MLWNMQSSDVKSSSHTVQGLKYAKPAVWFLNGLQEEKRSIFSANQNHLLSDLASSIWFMMLHSCRMV